MSYFLTGTDTGVGKTYVASLLIRALRKAGFDTVGLKPICCGDRAFRKSQSTRSRSCGSASIFRCFGRLRDFLAPVSARCARYARRPPCRVISRDTTDGSRPIAVAMSFCCIFAARQREISSLSANVSTSRRMRPPIHSRIRQSIPLQENHLAGIP